MILRSYIRKHYVMPNMDMALAWVGANLMDCGECPITGRCTKDTSDKPCWRRLYENMAKEVEE